MLPAFPRPLRSATPRGPPARPSARVACREAIARRGLPPCRAPAAVPARSRRTRRRGAAPARNAVCAMERLFPVFSSSASLLGVEPLGATEAFGDEFLRVLRLYAEAGGYLRDRTAFE